jgi:hypothetical protein
MMLTGCPRDTSMYPNTERWDESVDSVASSSGAMPGEERGAFVDVGGFDELPLLAPWGWEMNEVRAVATPDGAIPLRA